MNDRIKIPKDIAAEIVEANRLVMGYDGGSAIGVELLTYIAETYPELVEEYPWVFEDMK